MHCYGTTKLTTPAGKGVRNTNFRRQKECFPHCFQLQESEQVKSYSNIWSAKSNSRKPEVILFWMINAEPCRQLLLSSLQLTTVPVT